MKYTAVILMPWLATAAGLLPGPASASSDELSYPASQCAPFDGASWNGGGSQGFAFDSWMGGWYNYHPTQDKALVCPVPYFVDTSDPERIRVGVVAMDGHATKFIRAYLCKRPISGNKVCVWHDNFPTIYGLSNIQLIIQPDPETRFVWLEVVIPDNDDDDDPWTLRSTSGLLGYRVVRE